MTPLEYVASRAAAALFVGLLWVLLRRKRDGR